MCQLLSSCLAYSGTPTRQKIQRGFTNQNKSLFLRRQFITFLDFSDLLDDGKLFNRCYIRFCIVATYIFDIYMDADRLAYGNFCRQIGREDKEQRLTIDYNTDTLIYTVRKSFITYCTFCWVFLTFCKFVSGRSGLNTT